LKCLILKNMGRKMLLDSSLLESKRREAALKIINSKVKKRDRSHLYDLTGLSGGFPLKEGDIDLLETYAGPAIFEEKLQYWGLKHLGGEKVLALNRTSTGILATIIALVKPYQEVVHYLPQLPSHPSIPLSVKLVGADYVEYDDPAEFKIGDRTALVVVTGSTMDHQIIPEEDFRGIVKICKTRKVPVLADDASGARLRTIIYKQPRAIDMGADIAITSTDKLMEGPRGGLMSGKKELIDLIMSKAHQYGLEAQPPLMAGMMRALEKFDPERIIQSTIKRQKIYDHLKNEINNIKETPTGIMLLPHDIVELVRLPDAEIPLNQMEASNLMAMILLREYHIVTIPAVGMPGASPTIRLDMASPDAERLDAEYITNALKGALFKLKEVVNDEEACRDILFS
jgi:L-seryl-tRNA(Ser) seleniumtransferase